MPSRKAAETRLEALIPQACKSGVGGAAGTNPGHDPPEKLQLIVLPSLREGFGVTRNRFNRGWDARDKPVSSDHMTTAILLTAGFVFWVLHWFSATTLDCATLIEWWGVRAEHPGGLLLTISALSVVTAIWFLANTLAPKPRRVPLLLRLVQGLMPAFMVLISVHAWGLYAPNTPTGERARALVEGFEESGLNAPFRIDMAPLFETSAHEARPGSSAHARTLERAELEARYPPLPSGGSLRMSPFRTYQGVAYCEALEAHFNRWDRALYWDAFQRADSRAPDSRTPEGG